MQYFKKIKIISNILNEQNIKISFFLFFFLKASLVAHMVKNLPAMWKTRVPSLVQENSLGKGIVTHSTVLAWRIPWTEESGRLHTVHGITKSRM